MIGPRILDGLFKALDLAEELHAAVQRLRGRTPAPAPWQAPVVEAPRNGDGAKHTRAAPARRNGTARTHNGAKKVPRKKAVPRRAEAPAGTPLDGLMTHVKAVKAPDESVAVDGKTLPGRIVWALAHAQQSLGRGLTSPEISRVLDEVGVPTVNNNIMRAVRQDGGKLFLRRPGQGRAVHLSLTQEGCDVAGKLLGVSLSPL